MGYQLADGRCYPVPTVEPLDTQRYVVSMEDVRLTPVRTLDRRARTPNTRTFVCMFWLSGRMCASEGEGLAPTWSGTATLTGVELRSGVSFYMDEPRDRPVANCFREVRSAELSRSAIEVSCSDMRFSLRLVPTS